MPVMLSFAMPMTVKLPFTELPSTGVAIIARRSVCGVTAQKRVDNVSG